MPNGWRGLQAILKTCRDLAVSGVAQEAAVCPNDGQTLLTNVNGVIYCPYDGFRPNK